MSTSSNRQNSRFSTLNVFKFGNSPKPPPPPPKDPYYLPNHSVASLAPSLPPPIRHSTEPTTPMSSRYAASARSPSPSPSYAPSYTPSYAPSSVMNQSTTSLSTESGSSRKGFFKSLSLGKKAKTPKLSPSNLPDQPSGFADDPSISLPWNFQHNVHVDEAFVGLPPTWSASLAEMGFSEDEIAAIHARRAQSRPTLYALRSSTDSPSSSSHSVVMRPNPRSSSLMRSDTDVMSQHSESSYAADVSHNMPMSTDYSDVSMSEGTASMYNTPRSLVRSPDMMSQRSYRTATTPSPSPPPPEPGPSRSIPASKDRPPRTPTKRSYHVTNDSTTTMPSPPPAYRSPKKDSVLDDVNDDFISSSASAAVDPEEASHLDEEEDEIGEEPSFQPSALRLSVLPPRLSLHQDSLSDLASWSETLFSILPSDQAGSRNRDTIRAATEDSRKRDTLRPDPEGSRNRDTLRPSADESRKRDTLRPNAQTAPPPTPSSSANVRSSVISVRKPSSPEPSSPESPPTPQSSRLAPHKPIPLHVVSGRPTPPPSPGLPPMPKSSASNESTSSNPLWNEVYNMVRSPDSGSASPNPSPLFFPATPGTATSPATSEEADIDNDGLHVESSDFSRDKENRDSSMSTMTVTPATIVRHVSVAKRARANVIKSPLRNGTIKEPPVPPVASGKDEEEQRGHDSLSSGRSHSPASSESNSSDTSSVAMSTTTFATGSGSSGSRPQTLTLAESQKWKASVLLESQSTTTPYVESSPQPSPIAGQFDDTAMITSATVRNFRDCDQPIERPSIVIDDISTSDDAPWSASSSTLSPATPAQRYPGWISTVVEPIKDFMDETIDPNELYIDLREIAEGESGSVFAAKVASFGAKPAYVAIKQIALVPSGSPKLADLGRELRLMYTVRHPQILTMDALYIDPAEDMLWIKMELMDRSLADILALVEEGVSISERHISQFAADIVAALSYLRNQGIVHRDIRSDNLLINSSGVVKIADFSSAVKVARSNPMRSDPAGVVYWQAPEMRSGSYNALKVDVWSLGATVWELAETQPPYSDVVEAEEIGDQLPPLSEPSSFSQSFHDFLEQCSKPSSSRPDPDDLLNAPFIRYASWRPAVLGLLAQCRAIEAKMSDQENTESLGTVS